MACTSCATLGRSPVGTAETPQQKAYALYGSFVVLEEAAANFVTGPFATEEGIRVIKQADAIAKPAADLLHDSAKAYADAEVFIKLTDEPTAVQLQAYQNALVSLTVAYDNAADVIKQMANVFAQYHKGE